MYIYTQWYASELGHNRGFLLFFSIGFCVLVGHGFEKILRRLNSEERSSTVVDNKKDSKKCCHLAKDLPKNYNNSIGSSNFISCHLRHRCSSKSEVVAKSKGKLVTMATKKSASLRRHLVRIMAVATLLAFAFKTGLRSSEWNTRKSLFRWVLLRYKTFVTIQHKAPRTMFTSHPTLDLLPSITSPFYQIVLRKYKFSIADQSAMNWERDIKRDETFSSFPSIGSRGKRESWTLFYIL